MNILEMNPIELKSLGIKILLSVIIMAAFFVFGFFFSKNHWQAPLIEDKEKMASIIKESNVKIEMIQKQSKTDSKEAEQKIKDSSEKIEDIASLYEEEKKKRKVVEILVPGAKEIIEVRVESDGSPSCSNLGNDFADSVNRIIEEANK